MGMGRRISHSDLLGFVRTILKSAAVGVSDCTITQRRSRQYSHARAVVQQDRQIDQSSSIIQVIPGVIDHSEANGV